MATEVRLPQLGQTMEEGTIVGCMVKVGDEVTKGDVIFEIETDKATLEMESPAGGFVKHILTEVDQTVSVGEPLLVLGDKDEKVDAEFIESLKAAPAKVPAAVQTAGDSKTAERKAAVSKAAAAATVLSEVKLCQTVPLTKKQKITARKMMQSKREIPCFYINVKADVTDLVALRAELNKAGPAPRRGGVKIFYSSFIMRAVAMGLQKFSVMTGRLEGDIIRLSDSINIGLAISVPDGLVAPIVKDVDKKDLTQIARDSKVLIEMARNNKLSPTDLEGGCITISNLGALGVESFIPIVVPGQCSSLGIGRIADACMPNDGDVVVRKLMNMNLSVDHRVANGAYAAEFLDFVRKALEDISNFK